MLDQTVRRGEYDSDYANMHMRFDTNPGPKKTKSEAQKAEAARQACDNERAAIEAYHEMIATHLELIPITHNLPYRASYSGHAYLAKVDNIATGEPHRRKGA
jgi:hypothetical protein